MTSTKGTVGALEHLRVLDLTGYLGQACARMFGDMGADVILVERPCGDATREIGPFAGDKVGPDRGLPWTAFNRNKRSVVLDLTTDEGRTNAVALAGTADVVIEDALQYVRDKVDQAKPDLPDDAEEPSLSEANVAEFPIMMINISGPI
ncbi:MAG: CoA transferase, partial [Dehalococcoidia bacterium]|nr:CoA transferase [Dehalococcoidia bacterium]